MACAKKRSGPGLSQSDAVSRRVAKDPADGAALEAGRASRRCVPSMRVTELHRAADGRSSE